MPYALAMAVTTQQLLDAVEAALLGTLDREAQGMQVEGRAITAFSPRELLDLRDRLQKQLQKETTGNVLPMMYGVQEPMR